MIQFNATIEALLLAPVVESFYLVKIDTYLTTSYYRDLTMDNGVTYPADGRLVSSDPPQLNTIVDREIFKIILADPTYIFGDELDANLIGKNAEVRIGFVNQSTKQPYTEIANTLLIYKGMIESSGYSIETTDRGENQLVITCASPLANLDEVRQLNTSKKSLAYINGGDTSFDQVYDGSSAVVLRWGRV